MRCLVTGIGPDGGSLVAEEVEIPQPSTDVDVQSLFRTYTAPAPARPEGRAGLLDLGVPAGTLRWVLTRWAPGSDSAAMHHTDTVDLDLVVSGSIDLLLDDGAHHLEAGDAVVITGVDHGWRTGTDGCVLSVVLLGTPPPTSADG
jgi:hypothetical protein